ncbi:putative ATP-grasp-modified RiPP [Protofrankia symbiont of Coriaria ruscifolia]|uniref:putative ATP-grasp-modified RiPP n=1 Tax=Protofrankia symbiont of Coriaria ruscifolia TaxID=1306542 RepID=UPI0024156E64|nr:putative ATP-grasp-modified RiPP [Protofrankia symbiont of Coriaria ruscifolia]
MFPLEDRLPAYPVASRLPETGLPVRPWGVTQARPCRDQAAPPEVPEIVRIELDPVTQLSVCYDADGRVITDAGKHRKTYEWRERSRQTPDPNDGSGQTVADHERVQVEVD